MPILTSRSVAAASSARRWSVAVVALALTASACASGDDRSDAPSGVADAAPTTASTSTEASGADAPATTVAATPGEQVWGEKPVVLGRSEPPPAVLVINDLIEGDGAEATAGNLVTVHYVGVRYEDGGQFDASWDRGQPFPFTLGVGQVIQGWDQGFAGMKVGGRRELIIPSDLAYGDRGSGADIPPGQTLIFVVDMLDVIDPLAYPEPFENSADRVAIPNQGSGREGTALSSSFGTAGPLFVGDELNPNVPTGEGLQIWLAFGLGEVMDTIDENDLPVVTLRSQALQRVDGDPFGDFGDLMVQLVAGDSFPPDDAARDSGGPAVACVADVGAGGLTCDVSELVADAVAGGAEELAFRLFFDTLSDEDGQPDLVYFFVSDENTNEIGNFTLEFEPAAG